MLKLSVLSWSVMATFAVIGCASVDVRGVGTGTTQASYELRGKTMTQLEVEAQRLCPRGHEVQHRWQRSGGFAYFNHFHRQLRKNLLLFQAARKSLSLADPNARPHHTL